MDEYIKREDAIRSIADHDEFKGERWIKEAWADYLIEDAKPADIPPVRHGIWIEYGENKDGTHNICCSVCDGFLKSKGHANSCYTRNKYRYCHNCGARMDWGED